MPPASFSPEPVQLQFAIQGNIAKLLVSSNVLYLVLASGVVHRINLDNPEKVDRIAIELGQSHVKNAFCDRQGHHLVVQSTRDNFYYVGSQSAEYRELSKMRGLRVCSVAFLDKHVHETGTGPMIVATEQGVVYEVSVEGRKDRVCRQVYKSREGIVHVCSTVVSESASEVGYKVLCAQTNNKIVQFAGSLPADHASLLGFFKSPVSFNFNSLLHMTSTQNQVAFLDVSPVDSSFQITYGSSGFGSKKELRHFKLGADQTVSSIMLTRYYVLLLTAKNELVVVNQLSGKQVSRQSLTGTGQKFVATACDSLMETYWLYSAQAIYEVVVENENSGIWRLMVDRNLFDEALETLDDPEGKDAQKRDLILISKGRHLLQKRSFDKAAKVLAETTEPLEETALHFIEEGKPRSLRIYLTNKLRALGKEETMRKTILSSWLIELYVEGLNQLDSQMSDTRDSVVENDAASVVVDAKVAHKKETFLREFYSFLQEFQKCLDKETVYQLILSHNRKEELLYFANMIGDYNFVLKYYLSLQKWEESLKVLSLQQDAELLYKYSTLLFVNYPVKTCDIWVRLIDSLNYVRLLPAVLFYSKTVVPARHISAETNQALRFLDFLIRERKVKDPIIHNTMLALLISYPGVENEDLVLKYLERQRNSRTFLGSMSDEFDVLFDTDFVLRLCFRYRKTHSAIYIYSMMKDYEEAVWLALKHDYIETAITVADRPSNSRKKLWLKVAAKLIQKVVADDKYMEQHREVFSSVEKIEGSNISRLIKFLLGKCDELSMKDILPLFPDFLVIDNFKEDVVKSLQELSAAMSGLSVEMEDSIAQSGKINTQIAEFQHDSFKIIEPYESCMLCHKILTTRKFIVFPCFHSFHQDCLVKQILESNDYKTKTEVYKLQKRIVQNSGDKAGLTAEIDALLSQRCILCTEIKINEIEQSLGNPGDDEWAI